MRSTDRILPLITASLSCMVLGCSANLSSPVPIVTPLLHGKIYGGQQPVSLSTIQLYAVNITATAGSSSALLTSSVTTDANGNFSIQGDYQCPTNTATPVYLVATGGNPGLSGTVNNTALTLMALLGPCSTLLTNANTTYIDVNEVTTVAAAFALGNFMTDSAHVGAASITTITSAFTLANELANTTTGMSPGPSLPATGYAPSTKLNTLANVLAACVNSDGTGATGNTTPCGKLFTATTYSSTMPANTLAAAIRVAANPATGVATLFNQASTVAPFAPALSSSPTDWTMTIASVSWATPSAITYGTSLSASQLDATATVPGSFSYSPSASTVLSAGTQSLSTTFTATDSADYPTINSSVPLTVNQATPTVTWATPSAITAGTALSSTQLNASSTVAGSYSYTPASGTLFNDGAHTLSTLFTPTDTTDYTTASKSVSLTVNNATPSYTFQNVRIVGGGYVTGIVCHPTAANVRYVRTDVGGAYKWNQTAGAWVAITDFNNRNNYNYGGTDSIAIDPSDSNRLYLAVGEYTESYGSNGEFLLSDDQGTTFTTVAAPFKMGSNDNGRSAGERLAVDPNLGTTLFYGSYNSGLWTSTNRGTSWTQVSSFPFTGATSGAGVVFVDFITGSGSSGSATPVIYVGVSDTGTSSTGYSSLYRSTNGGSTWTAVPGQPTGYYPIHGVFGPDGNLYIAYSNGIGPGGITSGQVWKYTPPANTSPTGNGTWTNITPTTPARASGSQGGFSGIAVDPNNSGVVYTSTIDDYYPGDDIYVSTNGGTTWKSVLTITHPNNVQTVTTATYNTSLSPWVLFGASSMTSAGTWPSALAVDPSNSNHFMYGTGQTLWDSTNIQNAQSGSTTAFSIGALGIEETVVQALASPPSGADVISGVSDLGGFVNTSLTASPTGGMIENPRFGSITGVDFAQSSPSTVAVVGPSNSASSFGSYSTNGGTSWTSFASQAPNTTAGAGAIAVSADGTAMVWAPSDAAVAYSTNNAASWTASTGATAESGVIADRVNANNFYILTSAGTLLISTNKGASFTTAATGLKTYSTLFASYAAAGDLWLASGGGLYHSTNAGTSFTAVSGISAAYSVGFGAAASYSTYPTIFITGSTTANGYGFFRSTDGGSTWLQMNTSANQYGYANPIVGDPKTFGLFYLGTGGRGVIYGTSPQ